MQQKEQAIIQRIQEVKKQSRHEALNGENCEEEDIVKNIQSKD